MEHPSYVVIPVVITLEEYEHFKKVCEANPDFPPPPQYLSNVVTQIFSEGDEWL